MIKIIGRLVMVLLTFAGWNGRAHSAIPITDTVIVNSKEWAEVYLFNNLSWNAINAQCPTGVCGAGSVLNGWEMEGWTWASRAELNLLFNSLVPAVFPWVDDTGHIVDQPGDSTWAPTIVGGIFTPTRLDSIERPGIWVNGLTSTATGYSSANNSYVVDDYNNPPGNPQAPTDVDRISTWDQTSKTWTDPGMGAWFWRTPSPSVSVGIVDGDLQECSVTNGANVAVVANVNVVAGDPAQSIEWEVNGTLVAEGSSVNVYVPLGIDNTITVHMMTVSGATVTDTEQITIQDTVAANISAAFVDQKSGLELSQIVSGNEVLGIYDVTDTCDPNPEITATVGAGISNGDPIKPKLSKNAVGISVIVESNTSTSLEMTAVSTDASGNTSEKTISIPVIK